MKRGILTDLDGTLLDSSYRWQGAEQALEAAAGQDCLLVFATTKTEPEVLPYLRELYQAQRQARAAAVVENGGGILWPTSDDFRLLSPQGEPRYRMVPLGEGLPVLQGALEALQEKLDFQAESMLEMSRERLQEYTGLPASRLEAARTRRFDLPFVIRSGQPSWEALVQEADARGLKVSRGGLFYHLHGRADKGTAVRWIQEQLGKEFPGLRWLALGDSPVDISFLQRAQEAVLVPRADGSYDRQVQEALPGIRLAPRPAPAGWAEAVCQWLAQGAAAGKSGS